MTDFSDQDVSTVNGLAALNISNGRCEVALSLLRLSRDLRPEVKQTYFLAANALFRLERYDESITMIQSAPAMLTGESTVRTLFLQVVILLKNNQISRARDILQVMFERIRSADKNFMVRK